jgi:preprotein translocase subunit YajC
VAAQLTASQEGLSSMMMMMMMMMMMIVPLPTFLFNNKQRKKQTNKLKNCWTSRFLCGLCHVERK